MFWKENEALLFYAVADGVSSCKNSRKGAEISCEVICDIMFDEFDYFFNSCAEKASWLIVNYIKKQLHILAEQNNQKIESYASTLCFICIEKVSGRAITFTLGDSHIYILNSNEAFLEEGILDYFDNMICATVTQNAEKNAIITFYDKFNFDGVIICSDGAWKTLFYWENCDKGKKWYVKDPVNLLNQLKYTKTSDDATVLYVA